MTANAAVVLLYLVGMALADEVPNLNDANMITAGRKLFQEKQCASCHGPTGEGGIKLAGRSDLNQNYVFDTIADGRSDGGLRMPSWRGVLTDEQIWQATAYVLSLSPQVR